MRGLALLSFVAVAIAPATASAYRPFDGTDADVAKPGEFELEIGPGYLAGRGLSTSLALPSFVLNQGLFPHWELVVDGKNVVPVHHEPGERRAELDDTDVQLKWVFREGSLQGKRGVSLATEFGALLPTTGEERGVGAIANLIASYKWSALAVHLDLGGAVRRDDRFVTGSIIMEGPFRLAIRPVLEVLVSRELSVATLYSTLCGFIWKVGEDTALDAGLRRGMTAGQPFTEVRLGLTWSFPVWSGEAPTLPEREATPRERH